MDDAVPLSFVGLYEEKGKIQKTRQCPLSPSVKAFKRCGGVAFRVMVYWRTWQYQANGWTQ